MLPGSRGGFGGVTLQKYLVRKSGHHWTSPLHHLPFPTQNEAMIWAHGMPQRNKKLRVGNAGIK
jgi:hypothetical protein